MFILFFQSLHVLCIPQYLASSFQTRVTALSIYIIDSGITVHWGIITHSTAICHFTIMKICLSSRMDWCWVLLLIQTLCLHYTLYGLWNTCCGFDALPCSKWMERILLYFSTFSAAIQLESILGSMFPFFTFITKVVIWCTSKLWVIFSASICSSVCKALNQLSEYLLVRNKIFLLYTEEC